MKDSNKLRNMVLYQIFVRQYGMNHNFIDVKNDLPRIKEMGVDIIYLMPIFVIGEKNRKGSFGSPYAINDYNKIDPFLGGEEMLKDLINEAHKFDLKIIVDLALNHTGCDATLLKENEDYYYHKDGKVSRKCEDWSDVYDLDYNNEAIHPIIIEKVCNLLKMGFDGFRMDVCSLIPMFFWKKLYSELIKINDDVILIGESVHPEFRDYIRKLGVDAPSDGELYEVFDCLYQYDIDKSMVEMKNSRLKKIGDYLHDVEHQQVLFSKPKLRYLENHDTERIASYNIPKLHSLHALNHFLPGLPFIYNGEEYGIKHRPDLFELDRIKFEEKREDYFTLYKKLYPIKKMDYFAINDFKVISYDNNTVILRYKGKDKNLYGIFNFGNDKILYLDYLNEGDMVNLINKKPFVIGKDKRVVVKDILIFEN